MIALFIVISAHFRSRCRELVASAVSVARADTVVICRQDRKSVGRSARQDADEITTSFGAGCRPAGGASAAQLADCGGRIKAD